MPCGTGGTQDGANGPENGFKERERPMRSQNIVLFSSGVSEREGISLAIRDALEGMGYSCSYWRELFRDAKDSRNISLLPMLVKKIPTFDFAVLICEGHDRTMVQRTIWI